MTWLMRAAQLLRVAPAMIALGLVAGLLRGDRASVPSLSQGALVPVPVVAVIALVPATVAVWSWSQVPRAALLTSSRGTVWSRLVLCVAPTLFGAASGVTGGGAALLENARNGFGLLAIGLVGARLLGERAALFAPVVFLLACLLAGRGPGSGPYAWAWIIQDGGSVVAGLQAGALTLAGWVVAGGLPRVLLNRDGP